MKNYLLILTAAAIPFLFGCGKEDISAPSSGPKTVKVSAMLDATKVGVDTEGKFSWESGDAIGVWTGSSFTKFTLDESAVGTVAGTFTGTLPEGGTVNESSYAVYPYNESDTLDGTSYTTSHAFESFIPMYAKPSATVSGSTTVASYKFCHLGAIARITLKNIPVETKYLFFESTKKIFLGGSEIKADFSAEYPKFTEGARDYGFFALPEHTSAIESLTITIPLAPGEYGSQLKFRIASFTAPNFDEGSERDDSVYGRVGYLSNGVINRGDVIVMQDITY